MNEYLVITWTDSAPAEDGRAEAARDRGGQLLAAGPAHDAGERPVRASVSGASDHLLRPVLDEQAMVSVAAAIDLPGARS
jgi:hypothetical protein